MFTTLVNILLVFSLYLNIDFPASSESKITSKISASVGLSAERKENPGIRAEKKSVPDMTWLVLQFSTHHIAVAGYIGVVGSIIGYLFVVFFLSPTAKRALEVHK